MEIMIETLWHRLYHVEIENSMTIFELKEKLMDMFGFPPNHQRLILKNNGKWLQNEHALLQDYGVYENSLIIMSIQQGTSRLHQRISSLL